MLNGLGDAAEIEKTRSELAADTGLDVRFDGADLMDPLALTRLAKATEVAFGRLDRRLAENAEFRDRNGPPPPPAF